MVDLPPVAYVGLVAVFLRTYVGVKLLGDSLGVNSEVGCLCAVNIVFNRSSAVVFYAVKAFRHGHLHAETEHRRYFCVFVGGKFFLDLDSAGVVDGVCHCKTGADSRNRVGGGDFYQSVCFFCVK